ncbi:hypothetical protein ACFO3D_13700 [Virgibacillus kekensis]|uniref:Uncharacterized protein n=1 Tax=Virgibacillus kekensis TaxID=202261 RepID=A0ABV9DLK5_9BACI
MRRLIEGSIIALIFIGAVLFLMPAITDPKPPLPTIVADGEIDIPVSQGSYCWSGLLSSKCVDMVSAEEISGPPVSVPPEAVLFIGFDKEPLNGSLGVQLIKNRFDKSVPVSGGKIIAPAEKGKYIYMVHANWEEGSSSYAFQVKVE